VCTHPSAVVTLFTILQPICDWCSKLETGSRLTIGAFTPPTRRNSTSLSANCSDSSRLSPTSCEFNTHRRHSWVASATAVCIGLKTSIVELMRAVGKFCNWKVHRLTQSAGFSEWSSGYFVVTRLCGMLTEVPSLCNVNCRLDQMFSDAFARDHQLLKTDPKHGLYLACGLIVRGNVEMSDIRRNIDRFATAERLSVKDDWRYLWLLSMFVCLYSAYFFGGIPGLDGQQQSAVNLGSRLFNR